MKDENELKPCPLCGRKAVREDKQIVTQTEGLYLNQTTIRCEGKTHKTHESKGCNVRCSASNTATAIRMWNRRIR